MTDETRDALLLALAEAVTSLRWLEERRRGGSYDACDTAVAPLHALLTRARHERDYPEDRG